MSKTETKMVQFNITIDEKSKNKLMKMAAKEAERIHSNPTAVIREKILVGFGIEGRKPRNYTRSISQKAE